MAETIPGNTRLIDGLRRQQMALIFLACALALPTSLYDLGLLAPWMYRTFVPALLVRLIALSGMAVFILAFAIDTGRHRIPGLIVGVFGIAALCLNVGKDAYRAGLIADSPYRCATFASNKNGESFCPADPLDDNPASKKQRKHTP